jgi:polyisoprenoid-binding protein YceI
MKTWTIDASHSEIAFKVKHLMISTVRGHFGSFEGSMTASDDTFNDATINFSADVASITTKDANRDGHLQSEDFFNAAEFPKVTFTSSKVTRSGDDLAIDGDLTMRGITQPVTLKAIVGGIGTGMDGKRVAGFEITGSVNRQDFGLTWNATLETGGVVVSDEVKFDIHIEAKETD